MNPNHILSLIQDDYTTIEVVFIDSETSSGKSYVYKILHRDNPVVGECCVVASKYSESGYAIVAITAVHDEPRINTSVNFDYSWVVQKIDPSIYNALLDLEHEFAQEVRALERTHMREQIAKNLLDQFPETSEAHKALSALLKSASRPLEQLEKGTTNGSTYPDDSGNSGNA